MLPSQDERGGRPDLVQFRQHELGVAGAGDMRPGVGHAGGKVVGLIDDQQRFRRIETRTLIEHAAAVGREDVVVVADPDVVEGQGGAGDFVGTDARLAPGGPQRLQFARLVVAQVEAGQAALRPAGLQVSQEGAHVAHTMEDLVDTVLGFGPHLPRGDRRGLGGGRRTRAGVERGESEPSTVDSRLSTSASGAVMAASVRMTWSWPVDLPVR